MKIALVYDKPQSAIHRLCLSIIKHNPHLEFISVPLHPKRADQVQIDNAKKAFKECDILHVAYWKSGLRMREVVNPLEWEQKKKILCHYNPYDVALTRKRAGDLEGLIEWTGKDEDSVAKWGDMFDIVIVGNSSMWAEYPVARHISYGIDLDFWTYKEEYTEEKVVNMVVARIEGKKGCLEVAKACKELGYKFVLVGRISKRDYFDEVANVYKDDKVKGTGTFEFKENITDEELKDVYHSSAIHVCNSIDAFESGTLPLLEAMASGCPVLTRNIGHVPDVCNDSMSNMVVRKGEQSDVEDLKRELKGLMGNIAVRQNIRKKGWDTVKNWGCKRMAWKFEKLYYELVSSGMPFVSVIIPTKDKPDVLVKCLSKMVVQDYLPMEIVIADSGDTPFDIELYKKSVMDKVGKAGLDLKLPPIKYLHFDNKGEYTLAKARNLAVLRASGDTLVFCDERIGVEQNAVGEFVKAILTNEGAWFWGQKDGCDKSFVENWSCVKRKVLIAHGMFNESICSTYGCMTQEIRTRMEGMDYGKVPFAYVASARAKGLGKATGRKKRRAEIIESKDKLYKLYKL